ncbi:MAG: isocitrate/isopropylmalate family dehydrogenase, partial [Woeseia sp.]
GCIASAALLLRYSLRLEDEAALVESAISKAISSGARTADIATAGEKVLSTNQMTAAIIQALG